MELTADNIAIPLHSFAEWLSEVYSGDAGRPQDASVWSVAVTNLLDWAFFAVEDMEALPKHRRRVKERTRAGLCLDNRVDENTNPNGEECNCPAHARGVCKSHHHRFLMEKLGTSKPKRGAYEKDRVLSGTILPSMQGQGGGRPRKKPEAVA